MYIDKYASSERYMTMYVVPDVDHFDELNVLADPASEFFSRTFAVLSVEQ